jgi:hypothetical protein
MTACLASKFIKSDGVQRPPGLRASFFRAIFGSALRSPSSAATVPCCLRGPTSVSRQFTRGERGGRGGRWRRRGGRRRRWCHR